MNAVYEIAAQVQEWLAAGRHVRLATVLATRGISSQRPAATLAWTDGAPAVGALIDGIDPTGLPDGLVEVTISADEAAAAGLSCGGAASILVRPASTLPPQTWSWLVAGEPLCLVRPDDGTEQVFTATSIRDTYPFGDEIPRLFGRGVSAAAVLDDRAVIALWPVPRLVVVGDGLIADALRDMATLLGWPADVVPDIEVAGPMRGSDALVVLSHDRAVDGPALAAAVSGRAGYIGALGSRRTQDARRSWLTEHGVSLEDQARIHGPAGLDIDAHTPAEIAVSIVAEILATRSSSRGGSLRDREGPVHTAGVHAPPPRY